MKYLVTGGAGFIGSHLVDALIKTRHQVIVLDDLSSGKKENLNPKARFYQVNICDNLAPIFKKEKPEVIYHLAAQISVVESVRDPIRDAKVNILGTLNLLNYYQAHCHSEQGPRAAAKNLSETPRKTRSLTSLVAAHCVQDKISYKGVKKIIFTSSGGTIYGPAKKFPTPEAELPRPQSPYAISKLAAEYYLLASAIPCAILRLGNVYGPRQDPHGEAGVVAIFCGKVLCGQTPMIFGTGRQTRDYVYIDDVVQALLLAVRKKTPAPINISTGKETSVKQILKLIDAQIKPEYQPARQGELQRVCLDNSCAKKILNWQPEIDIAQGISLTKSWFASRIAC